MACHPEGGGTKIDPSTAEVTWAYAQTLDPYGVNPNLPEEYRQVGREYFARRPGSDVWVCFEDLPKDAARALWERYESKLAFPAGLLDFWFDEEKKGALSKAND